MVISSNQTFCLILQQQLFITLVPGIVPGTASSSRTDRILELPANVRALHNMMLLISDTIPCILKY